MFFNTNDKIWYLIALNIFQNTSWINFSISLIKLDFPGTTFEIFTFFHWNNENIYFECHILSLVVKTQWNLVQHQFLPSSQVQRLLWTHIWCNYFYVKLFRLFSMDVDPIFPQITRINDVTRRLLLFQVEIFIEIIIQSIFQALN